VLGSRIIHAIHRNHPLDLGWSRRAGIAFVDGVFGLILGREALLGLGWNLGLLAAAMAYIQFGDLASIGKPATKTQEHLSTGVNWKSQKTIEPFLPAFLCQTFTLGLFGILLDGGVHFRACCLSWLLYLPGAFIILVRRHNALTTGDLLYLKWAAVPMVVFGMPLFMYVFSGTG